MQTLILKLDRPLRTARLRGNSESDYSGLVPTSGRQEILADKKTDPPRPIEPDPVVESQTSDDIHDILSVIKTSIDRLHLAQTTCLNDVQSMAVQLAVQITTCLVKNSVQNSPERLTQIVEDAIANLQPSANQPLLIRINPVDAIRIKERWADTFSDNKDLQIIPDDFIEVGDCQIKAGNQTLIANLKQYLVEIETRIIEALSNE